MELVQFVFETLDTVKLYHWSTRKYADHKATDLLYTYLVTAYDNLMEVFFRDSEIEFTRQNVVVDVLDHATFSTYLQGMIMFLQSNEYLSSRDELKNIRDDIIANISKTLYLLRLE
jgi:hypothetical protein